MKEADTPPISGYLYRSFTSYNDVMQLKIRYLCCNLLHAGWRHILEKGINGRLDDMKVSGTCE